MKTAKTCFAAALFLAMSVAGCPCPQLDPREQMEDPREFYTDPPRDAVSYDPGVAAEDAAAYVERTGGQVLAVDSELRMLTVTFAAGAARVAHVTSAHVSAGR